MTKIKIMATRKRSPKKGIESKTFAEFFAGIGLVREGLAGSGWHCVYANDIDAKKQEIYASNFNKSTEFDLRDIWQTEEVLKLIPKTPALATASFPCTDLSLAGNYKGFEGEHSSTFFGFVDVLKSMGTVPKFVLLENVPGLLTARDGKDFVATVECLAALGYYVDAFCLDAVSFVPQSRNRVFVVGVHFEQAKSKLLAHKPKEFELDSEWDRRIAATRKIRPANLLAKMEAIDLKTGWVATPIKTPVGKKHSLRDIIDIDETDWWDAEETKRHHTMMSDDHRTEIDRFIKLKLDFVGTGYRRKRHDRTRLEIRFDDVAGCLRTPRGGSARQIVVAVVNGILKIRWMSPIEYARLQGAGGFTMLENDRQMLFGFGDAVCVPVIEWIDKCVLTPLFESNLK